MKEIINGLMTIVLIMFIFYSIKHFACTEKGQRPEEPEPIKLKDITEF